MPCRRVFRDRGQRNALTPKERERGLLSSSDSFSLSGSPQSDRILNRADTPIAVSMWMKNIFTPLANARSNYTQPQPQPYAVPQSYAVTETGGGK
jgi:hypothetical protein